MRRFIAVLIVLAACAAAVSAEPTRLLRFPDIHDGRIVFVYAGDLWAVGEEGGTAVRLTSDPRSLEWFPKFSADGSRIAFTGAVEGNDDVYVIPAAGGVPERLTWHPARDRVIGWTPDGKVLFSTRRDQFTDRNARLYAVGVTGGLPTPLPMDTGGAASFSPDGKRIAYNRIDRDRATWKRYRGGTAQDVWIHDLAKNKTTRVTTFEGTDSFPMWIGERIYFASDRTGVMNLWVHDLSGGAERQVTFHDEYDVKYPSLGTGRIVYENGGTLWVFDSATEKTREVPIVVPADRVPARPRWVNVADAIDAGSISPSGKRAALGARGEVFTVPAEKGTIRDLTKTSGAREREPVWSPDGRSIAYLSDATGEWEIYVRPQDGTGEARQVTRGATTYRFGLAWSPDSKKILFGDQDQKLFWLNLDGGAIHEIDRGVAEEIRQYDWSPDSRWVAYQATGRNRLGQIRLYSLTTGKVTPVTDGLTKDMEPVFDPKGRYLYFLSNRDMKAYLDVFDANFIAQEVTKIYAVTLTKKEPAPFAPVNDEETGKKEGGEKKDKDAEDGVKDKDKKDKKDKGKKKTEAVRPVAIDLEGIGSRIVALPVSSGNLKGLSATEDDVFYLWVDTWPLSGTWDDTVVHGFLQRFSLKDRKTTQVIRSVSAYDLTPDGKKVLYLGKDHIVGIVDSSVEDKSAGEGKLDLSGLEAYIDPAQEWRQMFFEAWRLERDFFYDPGMHGLDWRKVRDRYAKLLPSVADREDLNYLLGEMIGELGTSHTYVWGGDADRGEGVSVGLLGADLEQDAASGRYRIKAILPADEWNLDNDAPLAQPGLDVRPGDYLIAVDGVELRVPDSPYRPFANTTGKQVRLRLSQSPDGKDAREVTVTPIGSEAPLRYRRWVDGNRAKVAKATGGKIGYVHLPDMSAAGLEEFTKGFAAQIDKQGLVVDIRYNGGGFVSEMILERLRRVLATMFSARHAESGTYPWLVVHGPLVCIINEQSGSDGDIFPYFFRQYGLGKLVGRRTWGGVVGIRLDKKLIDGGILTMPEYGTYSLDRKWIMENHGVDPDVEVDNLPEDVLARRDPQLEKAIALALEGLKAKDWTLPRTPETFPR
jgi:tricorn protease